MKQLMYFMVGLLLLAGCAKESADYADEPEDSAPSYSFTEGHKAIWAEATAQIMELADAMPEDYYSYKPHDSVRTFAEQLVHIGGSSKYMANLFLKDTKPEGPPPEMDIAAMSKEEIKSMVKTNLDEAWEIMSSMSDEQLDEEVESFKGNTMTRRVGIMFIHDHLTNHKAKANLYVRISGNDPPSYRYY